MLNVKKLVHLTENTDPSFSFGATWREQLGIYEEVNPKTKQRRRRFDVAKGSVDPHSVSLQEIDMAFGEAIGWRGEYGKWSASDFKLRGHLTEAAVLPSTFAHISGFDQTIAGLLDALVLEAYDDPMFIGKELIGEQTWAVNGGKKIRVANDGQLMGETQIGMPLPEVGLKEYWITLPVNKRYGNQLSINKLDFVFDRTGQVQSAAEASGKAVAYEIENIIAAGVMGITNPFIANDVAGATYLAAAGTNPHNFKNWEDDTLVDWNNLNTAYVTMQSNTDPNTGFPIVVPAPMVLCSPQKYYHTRSILFPTMVQEYSAAIGAASTRSTYGNPIPDMGVNSIRSFGMIWYNKLIAAAALGGGAYTSGNAQKVYFLGRPDRAFKWMTIQPFSSWTAPITADDMAKGISQRHMVEEVGVFTVVEPRYILQSGDTTPTS